LDTSIRNPELKLQLLTRALEESRGKLQQLQRERAAAADTVAQLCLAAGASGPDAASVAKPAAPEDEAALPQRLERLAAQLQELKDAVQSREAEISNVQQQHEQAALQVMAAAQQREALEQQLQEVGGRVEGA
jgi:DNA repair exonuclease SbcCD ATPase subunit